MEMESKFEFLDYLNFFDRFKKKNILFTFLEVQTPCEALWAKFISNLTLKVNF